MTVVSFGYESLELFRSHFRLRVEDSIRNTFVNFLEFYFVKVQLETLTLQNCCESALAPAANDR